VIVVLILFQYFVIIVGDGFLVMFSSLKMENLRDHLNFRLSLFRITVNWNTGMIFYLVYILSSPKFSDICFFLVFNYFVLSKLF